MTQQYDANDVLMGGSGAKGWKFEDPGTTHVGTISEPPKAVQEREYDRDNPGGGAPKFFPSGDPIMGVHVVVATNERDATVENDTGTRTFYVEGRYIKEAVRNAVRAAGSSGLEVGGQLSVTFTHREDPMDKRSRKYWAVVYTPAANNALMGEQPQPAPVAQPTPAPAAAFQARAASPVPAAPQPVQQAPAPVAAAPAPAAAPASDEQLAAFVAWQATQPQTQQAG